MICKLQNDNGKTKNEHIYITIKQQGIIGPKVAFTKCYLNILFLASSKLPVRRCSSS